MSKIYDQIIAQHLELQQALSDDPESVQLETVQTFIRQAREAGAGVANTEQRDQLRKVLRYWGTFVHKQTGEYPMVQLAPASELDVPGLMRQAFKHMEASEWEQAIGIYREVLVIQPYNQEADRLLARAQRRVWRGEKKGLRETVAVAQDWWDDQSNRVKAAWMMLFVIIALALCGTITGWQLPLIWREQSTATFTPSSTIAIGTPPVAIAMATAQTATAAAEATTAAKKATTNAIMSATETKDAADALATDEAATPTAVAKATVNALATNEAGTATAEADAMATANALATNEAGKATAEANATATSNALATADAATATAAVTNTPAPTPPIVTDTLASALQPSSIFVAPNADSSELAFIQVEEQIKVLGRSDKGSWFYVRNDRGVEGFVHAPRMEWAGDWESLPIVTPLLTTPIPSSPPPVLSGVELVECGVIFQWTWVWIPPTVNEWFVVRVGLEQPQDIDWTKVPAYVYSLREPGEYEWEIAVCRGDPKTGFCEQLAVSERKTFFFDGCTPSPPRP